MSYAERAAATLAQQAPTAHLPESVEYDGREFWKTGKVGTNIATDLPSAEYRDENDERLWVVTNGRVEYEG